MISTSLIEKILRDDVDQIYCGHYEKRFVLQFRRGSCDDSANYKIIPLEDHAVVLGKQWLDERRASYKEETRILQVYIQGQCYQVQQKPKQPTPTIVQPCDQIFDIQKNVPKEATLEDKSNGSFLQPYAIQLSNGEVTNEVYKETGSYVDPFLFASLAIKDRVLFAQQNLRYT